MVRLLLLVILFLLSLLSIFPAPTYHLWLTAILVTEYPLLFIFPCLVLLLSGRWSAKYQISGTIVGVLALLLLASPLLKAYITAKTLVSELHNNQPPEISPFNLSTLIRRSNTKEVSYKEFTYSKTDDKTLSLKFFSSLEKGIRPCVVVIHGGSWKSGDNNQLPELNSYLASEGYHVAAINYHLAPKYKSPIPVNDVKEALKFLKEHSTGLAIDTSRFVLLGRSAGAQIALLAAYTIKDPGIKAVVDFYGPADMVWGYSLPANPLVLNSRKVMEDYLGGTFQQVPALYQKSSPILFVNERSVPTLIIHGKNDVLVAYEHSQRLYKKLQENNIQTYFLSLPWATHGFDFNINGPGGQLSTYAVTSFLEKVCR
ncbi:alpha/beta hydrolase [Desertivirga brevis]|uniref:alpha/beta hydrolase n=1 Tax=Desertivirga brevis TaxID=2810310 RepID=UPI001A9694DE|nr:alpha/beta hydrolase [Pedobacter sp. SYSU D00873]